MRRSSVKVQNCFCNKTAKITEPNKGNWFEVNKIWI